MLTRDGDKQYLLSLKERLEENGIPAVIQGEDTARMTIPAFLLEPTLWVYLDEQFEDAVQLINNPDYQVTSAIDVEEFYSREASPEHNESELNKALMDLALFTVFIMVVMFLFTKVLDALST